MLTNDELTRFLISTVSLLISAHAFGYAFQRLRLPRVIGEICGGLVLGPSVLGLLMPNVMAWLVADGVVNAKLLSAAYWLGLMLLMFTAGFGVQRNFDAKDCRLTGLLLLSATVIPFSAGCTIPYLVDLDGYTGPRGDTLTLALIFGIAMAVTSIPVISKIFIDLKIIETQFAKIVLAASTIQDVILWSVLAIATRLAAEEFLSIGDVGLSALRASAFVAVALLLGPPLLRLVNGLRMNFVLKASPVGYALAWCLLMGLLAAALDVNVIFGAFIAGVVLGQMPPSKIDEAKKQISSFGLGFFIPIYFAVVGFRIDLPEAFDPLLFIGFLALSTTLEGVCVFAVMRLSRCSALTSWNFSVAMNTRGGPGIVLASVTYDFGLIDERLFVTLVLSAIITSLAAGAWFRKAVTAGLPLLEKQTGEDRRLPLPLSVPKDT